MVKTIRDDEFDRISLKIILGDKTDVSFTVNNGVFKFSSKGISDEAHVKIGNVYRSFVELKSLKVPPSIRFNMIENLAHAQKDGTSFLIHCTLQNLYRSPVGVPTGDQFEKKPEKMVETPWAKAPKTITTDPKSKKVVPSSEATPGKYEYPEGMSAKDKQKFRAKARAEAKKAAS